MLGRHVVFFDAGSASDKGLDDHRSSLKRLFLHLRLGGGTLKPSSADMSGERV